MVYLMVFLGGGLGALARFMVGLWARGYWPTMPYLGTFFVNALGSFAIGFLAAVLLVNRENPSSLAPFLITGFLGGFTTYSAYALETIDFLQSGDVARAALYALGTMVIAVSAAYLGWLLGMRIG